VVRKKGKRQRDHERKFGGAEQSFKCRVIIFREGKDGAGKKGDAVKRYRQGGVWGGGQVEGRNKLEH